MDAEDPKFSWLHREYLRSEVALQFLPPPPLPLPHHPVLGIEPRTSHTLGKFSTPKPYPPLTTSLHTHTADINFIPSAFFFFLSHWILLLNSEILPIFVSKTLDPAQSLDSHIVGKLCSSSSNIYRVSIRCDAEERRDE